MEANDSRTSTLQKLAMKFSADDAVSYGSDREVSLDEDAKSERSNENEHYLFSLDESLAGHMRLLNMDESKQSGTKLLEELSTAPLLTAKAINGTDVLDLHERVKMSLPAVSLLAGRCGVEGRAKPGSLVSSEPNLEQRRGHINYPSSTSPQTSSTSTSSCPSPSAPQARALSVSSSTPSHDNRIFLNVNSPWSAFICGLQGTGKSHTLSCMLENCLLETKQLGSLPNPLAGLLFHFDPFNSESAAQPCEAAYLASAGVPVKVLVSQTNYARMKNVYKNLDNKIQVVALAIDERYLTAGSLLSLMSANPADGTSQPLYMQALLQVLRELAIAAKGRGGIDYRAFKRRMDMKDLTAQQRNPLNLRLDLLEYFILDKDQKRMNPHREKEADWTPQSGQLTIVDLSCPFVDADTACGLFDICLSIFLAQDLTVGRVVALDEAHKFMTATGAAMNLTESLKSVIRLQRHLGCRVIVATQEPTVAPSLLDLCSITFVHRFNSPGWLRDLRGHLAAIAEDESSSAKGRKAIDSVDSDDEPDTSSSLFNKIVTLGVGEALLCCPSAMMNVATDKNTHETRVSKLGTGYLKVKIRNRISRDGGRSIMTTQ